MKMKGGVFSAELEDHNGTEYIDYVIVIKLAPRRFKYTDIYKCHNRDHQIYITELDPWSYVLTHIRGFNL